MVYYVAHSGKKAFFLMEQVKYSRFEGLTKNCDDSAKHDGKTNVC